MFIHFFVIFIRKIPAFDEINIEIIMEGVSHE